MTRDVAYSRSFFEGQRLGSLKSAKVIVPLVMRLIAPQSVVSVGCGTGAWLSVFKEQGAKRILGLDGSYVDHSLLFIPQECFQVTDLTHQFRHEESFDLVECLEVAEHLPKSVAKGFVQSLVQLGPVILFSAAVPLQGGINHLNEQWPDYWDKLFQEHNYRRMDPIRKLIWKDPSVRYWYRQNIFLFVREDAIPRHPQLSESLNQADDLMLVHPDILYRHLELRRVIKSLPGRILRALWRRVVRLKKPQRSDRWLPTDRQKAI